jgi:toxin FitB
MRLIDTNLIIYAAKKEYAYLLDIIQTENCYYSAVSQVEVLGFSKLEDREKLFFETYFESINEVMPNRAIINQAITLRQKRKMSLGDAIIAATAIVHDFAIYTNNVEDFNWIKGLSVIDPLN